MMNDEVLKAEIIAQMQALGITTTGEHAKAALLAEAIAKATVKHIQDNAEVLVTSGSSAGSYKVN